jgi:hypothetical protein
MRACRLVIVVLAVLTNSGTGGAENYAPGSLDRYFRIDSAVTRGARGAVISGYVSNTYANPADRVRLIVERLDASGQVVSSSTTYVLGGIPPMGRAYFETPVPEAGATYRVRILSFDWIGRGGS